MSKTIRKLIYENKGDISSIDLDGTKLRHPKYGMGTIVKYCDCCYQLDIKFEGNAEIIPSHFDAIFGDQSKFKLSKKQLEQKFGHLRKNPSPQKAQFLCTTPPVVTPAVVKKKKMVVFNSCAMANIGTISTMTRHLSEK